MRLSILLVVAAAACSPYNPDLGDKPFLCGSSEPRCPEGYTAVDVTAVRCECVSEVTQGGGGGEACDNFNPDALEPNDGTSSATPTAIGSSTTTSYQGVAVCPGTDQDVYVMDINKTSTAIKAEVTYTNGAAPTVDILDPQGVSVRPTVNSAVTGKVTATFTSRVMGRHYAVVKAGAQLMPVDYTIDLKITPP